MNMEKSMVSSSIKPPPRGLSVHQHSQSHDSPQPEEKSPLQNKEREGDYTLTIRDAIMKKKKILSRKTFLSRRQKKFCLLHKVLLK